ncbi:MAG: Flp family type IVb pilin [Planctomycetes bacterium]|nr:Flp family type IVb pilin [Planctomycetota bacterium]
MKSTINQTMRFLAEECGTTATEYAVMLSLIVLASITAVVALGGKVAGTFNAMQAGLPNG